MTSSSGVVLAVWNPTSTAYDVTPTSPADTIRPGQGYWVRALNPISIYAVGISTAAESGYSIPLAAGWNMIGNPFANNVSLSSITVIDSDHESHTIATATSSGLVGGVLYTYQPSDIAYEIVPESSGSLSPYEGYWLDAAQPCTLSIPAP